MHIPENIPEVIQCGPMKLGKAYAQSVLDMDVYETIRPYEGPVLIVHGTKDEIVDCSYARKAAESYRNAQLVIIPDGKHDFSKEHDQIALEAVAQFVKWFLKLNYMVSMLVKASGSDIFTIRAGRPLPEVCFPTVMRQPASSNCIRMRLALREVIPRKADRSLDVRVSP